MDKNFLNILSEANSVRQEYWKGSDKLGELFRAVELGEESGEVLGAVKKLYRARNGVTGNNQTQIESLTQNLKEEIGDVLICLSLLASIYNLDLSECGKEKFNITSSKHGIPVTIIEKADGQYEVDVNG